MNQPASNNRYRPNSWLACLYTQYKINPTGRLAWILCGMICLSASVQLIVRLTNPPPNTNAIQIAGYVVFMLIPIAFAVIGALILSRQPRNLIGWLLLIPAFSLALPVGDYVNRYTSAPPVPPVSLLLALWFNSWGWLLLIFPILFISLLFPTGQPPSPRWRWLIHFGLATCAIFILLITFSQKLSGDHYSVTNPIGFLPDNEGLWSKYITVPWVASLISLTVLCVSSLFVRYRSATAVEREQIKWLLYAGGLFVAIYIPFFWITNFEESLLFYIFDFLFSLAFLAFPIAIAIAILRYRLWDIDVIIRRTLVYGALSLTLALVYLVGVVLLQALFQAITGQDQSPVATVISTLGIAALFTPLRRRIQRDIDRRFYRKKYDAEKVVAAFNAGLREKVDLDDLQAQIVGVVQETLQPEYVSLWLRNAEKEKR